MSDDAMYVPQGNGTEIGMVKFLSDNEISVQDLFTYKQRHSIVETNIPFGPIRKRQVVAVRTSKDSDYVRVIVKGAPENILPMCS
jgi:magnesium-transporting ATPase (P-type)